MTSDSHMGTVFIVFLLQLREKNGFNQKTFDNKNLQKSELLAVDKVTALSAAVGRILIRSQSKGRGRYSSMRSSLLWRSPDF